MNDGGVEPSIVRIGVDVGGTKMLGVVLDVADRVVAQVRRPTPRGVDNVDRLVDAVVELVSDLAAELASGPGDGTSGPEHVGVGIPGLVTRSGVLHAAANLDGVVGFPIRDVLAERLGRPVAVDNDGTCTALAEWRLGAAHGRDHVVSITFGTGIGGGLIADGRVLRGANGFAGEFGHMRVDPTGPDCPCGRSGCWERYASGTGISELARRAAAEGRLDGSPAPLRDPQPLGEVVFAAARRGDRGALGVVNDFAHWVAVGLAALTNALDPELFVLGGGMTSDGDLYLPLVRDHFGELLYDAELRLLPEIVLADLGEHAGAIGAALLER